MNGLLTPQRSAGTIIELSFRLLGRTIPVDHGYALYAALSRVVPELHGAQDIGVHPIRGIYGGDGRVYLTPFSRLTLRLPDSQFRPYLQLAGKKLDVAGHGLRIGISHVRLLYPSPALYARLVIIKGFMEPEGFLEAAKRQLQEIGATGDLRVGERRTLRVKDKQVVGFEVVVNTLTGGDAVKLQEVGLGGRRRFGCGVFVPYRGEL